MISEKKKSVGELSERTAEKKSAEKYCWKYSYKFTGGSREETSKGLSIGILCDFSIFFK